MKKANFIGVTVVAGVTKHRWECPNCKELGAPESRFNLSPEKDGRIHKCRFCKTELEL